MSQLGFGFLRLPMNEKNEVDEALLCQLVDAYIRLGGSYFDSAYTYLDGKSEVALRKAVIERYPREQLVIADKLPSWLVKKEEDLDDYFHKQCERCGVDYFDVYLIHWLNERNYKICEEFHQFEFLSSLKQAGKVKKIGFSFHDSPELLEEILLKHPEVDYVQLQINYLDWNSPTLIAKELYAVAKKYHKKVIVMEPVKGGSLAHLPSKVEETLKKVKPDDSIASWAIRFVSSLKEVEVVLSGMNTLMQVEDNMTSLKQISDSELFLLDKMARQIRLQTAIPCTKCGYCLKTCPKHISIPDYFELYNDYVRNPNEDWKMEHHYQSISQKGGEASSCVGCHHCEIHCPQQISIVTQLKKVTSIFD